MIHQYKSNGYNIVMDVESGSVHVVDDVTYDVIEMYENHSKNDIIAALENKYPLESIEESIEEVTQLKEDGQLYCEDVYEPFIKDFKKVKKPVVKALCLHIAHDCNLA